MSQNPHNTDWFNQQWFNSSEGSATNAYFQIGTVTSTTHPIVAISPFQLGGGNQLGGIGQTVQPGMQGFFNSTYNNFISVIWPATLVKNFYGGVLRSAYEIAQSHGVVMTLLTQPETPEEPGLEVSLNFSRDKESIQLDLDQLMETMREGGMEDVHQLIEATCSLLPTPAPEKTVDEAYPQMQKMVSLQQMNQQRLGLLNQQTNTTPLYGHGGTVGLMGAIDPNLSAKLNKMDNKMKEMDKLLKLVESVPPQMAAEESLLQKLKKMAGMK